MRADDQFIRDEVERQGFDLDSVDGKTRLIWMRVAWVWAEVSAEKRARPTLDDIMSMSYYIEPVINERGYRQVPVLVRGRMAAPWRNIHSAMEKLWEYGGDLPPQQFYYEFEVLHPFRDGNGRLGAIIYNWLRGTLYSPTSPPDMFDEREATMVLAEEPNVYPRFLGSVLEGIEDNLWNINNPIQAADEDD